ncbi:MAG: hypothetical protein ACHQQ3_10545 [Gemmatimonadales bacterium]
MRILATPAARRATMILAAAFLSLLDTTGARAQSGYQYELLVEGGAWLPTAAIHHDLESAALAGVAGRYMLAYGFALTASAWWAAPSDKNPTSASQQVSVTQGDLGLEWGKRIASLGSWPVVSLIGGGVGGRTYAPKNVNEPRQSSALGFGSLSLALFLDHFVWRVEARDNLSTWEGLSGKQSLQGNDVQLRAGAGWRW